MATQPSAYQRRDNQEGEDASDASSNFNDHLQRAMQHNSPAQYSSSDGKRRQTDLDGFNLSSSSMSPISNYESSQQAQRRFQDALPYRQKSVRRSSMTP